MSEAPGRLSMQAAAPIFRRQRELQKFATMADITVELQRVEGGIRCVEIGRMEK